MGIHDDVGTDALGGDWHVSLRHDETHYSLLAVARGELITHLRPTRLTQKHLHYGLTALRGGEHHLIHVRRLNAAVVCRDSLELNLKTSPKDIQLQDFRRTTKW